MCLTACLGLPNPLPTLAACTQVGHWLGLLHVFENGCDSPGDSVEDTAPQASAAYGCPKTRHTCPSSNEPEPIHNIMS